MISVQDAVKAVITYVQQFDQLMPADNMRLEEFSLDERGENWLITLSFYETAGTGFGQVGSRNYKTFTVSNQTNEVVAMKLRNPMAPLK
jgi:hypothetical protein